MRHLTDRLGLSWETVAGSVLGILVALVAWIGADLHQRTRANEQAISTVQQQLHGVGANYLQIETRLNEISLTLRTIQQTLLDEAREQSRAARGK